MTSLLSESVGSNTPSLYQLFVTNVYGTQAAQGKESYVPDALNLKYILFSRILRPRK